jgi:hypothetical protein
VWALIARSCVLPAVSLLDGRTLRRARGCGAAIGEGHLGIELDPPILRVAFHIFPGWSPTKGLDSSDSHV